MTKVARLLIDEAREEWEIETAKKLIKQGLALDVITETLGLPESKVKELQSELMQRLEPVPA
jgi:hypothetical protein